MIMTQWNTCTYKWFNKQEEQWRLYLEFWLKDKNIQHENKKRKQNAYF